MREDWRQVWDHNLWVYYQLPDGLVTWLHYNAAHIDPLNTVASLCSPECVSSKSSYSTAWWRFFNLKQRHAVWPPPLNHYELSVRSCSPWNLAFRGTLLHMGSFHIVCLSPTLTEVFRHLLSSCPKACLKDVERWKWLREVGWRGGCLRPCSKPKRKSFLLFCRVA